MNEEKEWDVTANRFVAFIDIMGFKDLVARNTHEEVLRKMKLLAKVATSNNKEDMNLLHMVNFSDSIIIFSKDDTDASFKSILGLSRGVFSLAMGNAIPMKGAVAHGLVSIDRIFNVYFGQALIDAYELQEQAHYYGIIAHNSFDKYITDKDLSFLSNMIMPEVLAPLKSGKIIHRTLNWFNQFGFWDEYVDRDKEFEKTLSSMKSITSGAPRKYIDNTFDVFRQVYPKE